MTGKIKHSKYSTLFKRLAEIIHSARATAVRQINKSQVLAYYEIGREIVEFEQKGKERAEYGEALLKKISADLTPQFGKGFTERNLWHMRQFYITYKEILHTPCAELPEKIQKKMHTLRAELTPISQTVSGISETLSRKFLRDFKSELEARLEG